MIAADYHKDIIAWSRDQVRLLREKRFAELDIDNIIEEIEDVGKSEVRELANCLAELIMHLLKYCYQPWKQTMSWLDSIRLQREDIRDLVDRTPSLKPYLNDPDWQKSVWRKALIRALKETASDNTREKRVVFPQDNPWTIEEILTPGWLPQAMIVEDAQAAYPLSDEDIREWVKRCVEIAHFG